MPPETRKTGRIGATSGVFDPPAPTERLIPRPFEAFSTPSIAPPLPPVRCRSNEDFFMAPIDILLAVMAALVAVLFAGYALTDVPRTTSTERR